MKVVIDSFVNLCNVAYHHFKTYEIYIPTYILFVDHLLKIHGSSVKEPDKVLSLLT